MSKSSERQTVSISFQVTPTFKAALDAEVDASVPEVTISQLGRSFFQSWVANQKAARRRAAVTAGLPVHESQVPA